MTGAPHPRMHGITHVTGGPDPIPGLLPRAGGTYASVILAEPSLIGYWPLNETSGDAVDHSGLGHDFANPAEFVGPPTQGVAGPFPDAPADTSYLFDPLTVETGDGHRLDQGITDFDTDTGAVSFECWLYPVDVGSLTGSIVAQYRSVSTVTFQITIRSGHNMFWGVAGTEEIDSAPMTINFDEWTHVVGVSSTTDTMKLYWNGALIAEGDPATVNLGDASFRLGSGELAGADWDPYGGRICQVALYNQVLSPAQITAHYQAGVNATGDTEGYILTIGEDGVPVWAPPPVPDVTVNDDEPAAAVSPTPGPSDPPTPPDDGIELDWIYDQPFTYDGASFDVPPNKWTTVPFDTPIMVRESNMPPPIGETAWTEIPVGDPDAAGWLNDESEYTRKAIVVPHDVEFLQLSIPALQACIRVETPAVEPLSYRGLRIFETTRQKTLLESYAQRQDATFHSGHLDVMREPMDVFANGGVGGLGDGEHDAIMFCPNNGDGNTYNGLDWLPRNSLGDAILKEGMRLVAQVWHNASVPVTFHANRSGVSDYRPHLVACKKVERDWGPPWSEWPEP